LNSPGIVEQNLTVIAYLFPTYNEPLSSSKENILPIFLSFGNLSYLHSISPLFSNVMVVSNTSPTNLFPMGNSFYDSMAFGPIPSPARVRANLSSEQEILQ
jgi:hypothetical protein